MEHMDKIFSYQVDDGLAVVTFDVPGEAVNTWTDECVEDFINTLNFISEEKKNIKGVIFISGKPAGFHAGANLKSVGSQENPDKMIEMIGNMHHNLLTMEDLGIPTLAAINGPCLGGGYEFVLAMTARIATDARQTIIGLPECNVGLFPGGGGTQRLPRLIGYPAIDLILKGRPVPSSKALKLGMIDRLVPAGDDLLSNAKEFIKEIIEGKVQLKRTEHDFSDLDSVIDSARKGILKVMRGRELPAHRLVLNALQEGLKVPLKESLAVEEKYFIEVINTPEAKGSINTFFLKTLSDKPKAMIPKGFQPKPLNKIAVLGFGTMGRGIIIGAITTMQVPVIVKDLPDALDPGMQFVRKILQGMSDKGRLKTSVDALCDLIKPVSEWTDDFKDVGLVIEAVFEDPEIKKEVYKDLCKVVSSDCIIASNTSSIPVTQLAKDVENPERFCGAHFFSPAWMMQLLEVIRGAETSSDTINNLLNYSALTKKRPIVCNDYPGFVVNAMLFPYMLKTFELLESGAKIEMIDKAITSFGLPVGPIRLCDEAGIDVFYLAFTKSMGLGSPKTIENMYESGRLGRKKSGKGFFLADGSVDPEVLPLIPVSDSPKEYTINEIQDMLLLPMVEVGKELLKNKIVDNPGSIDIGAIWGVGFPSDKGGPMKWADITGLSKKLYGTEFYS